MGIIWDGYPVDERSYNEFEVFKEGRGPGYGLYAKVKSGWWFLTYDEDYHPLRSMADLLNAKWEAGQTGAIGVSIDANI